MSTLNVANISDGTDSVPTGYVVKGSAKSWVNLYGKETPYIVASMNVSSLVDAGSGRYEIYLTSSMSSSNEYAITATKQDTTVNTDSTCFDVINSRSADAYQIISIEDGVSADSNNVNAVQMGELA